MTEEKDNNQEINTEEEITAFEKKLEINIVDAEEDSESANEVIEQMGQVFKTGCGFM